MFQPVTIRWNCFPLLLTATLLTIWPRLSNARGELIMRGELQWADRKPIRNARYSMSGTRNRRASFNGQYEFLLDPVSMPLGDFGHVEITLHNAYASFYMKESEEIIKWKKKVLINAGVRNIRVEEEEVIISEDGLIKISNEVMALIWNSTQESAGYYDKKRPSDTDKPTRIKIRPTGRGKFAFRPHSSGDAMDFNYNQTVRGLSADQIIHEYGHKVMKELYGRYEYESQSCRNTPHFPGVKIDEQCAFVEGWANFYSLAVRDSSQFNYPASRRSFDYDSFIDSHGGSDLTDEGFVTEKLWKMYQGGIEIKKMFKALQKLAEEPRNRLTYTFFYQQLSEIATNRSALELGKTEDHKHELRKRSFVGLIWTTENLDMEIPGSVCFKHKAENCTREGRLYTFKAANEACTSLGEGWRLPTDEDWKRLTRSHGGAYLDETDDQGKSAYIALSRGGSAGFNGGFGGKRYYFQESGQSFFYDFGTIGYYWSSTLKEPGIAISYVIRGTDQMLLRDVITSKSMISCRCVRDDHTD